MSDGNMDVDESPVSWKVKSSEALVDGSFSATLSSSSRVIPASRDFDFHHKLDEFRRPIDEIAGISQSVLETIGDSEQVWGKSMKLLGDVDAEDRLFNVNDEFHKRFDVSVDEFDKEEVIGRPDAYSGEDGFQKKKPVGNEIAGSSAGDMTRGSMIDDVKVAERDKNLSGKANVPFHVPTIKKPQEEYSILVNNASQPFEHDWLEWSEDGQRFMHHPLEKLSVIDFVDKDVNELEPVKPLSLEETPFKFVQEVKDLKELVAKLHSVDEFAVDLEQNQYRSSQGLTCCLMKISTRTEDYIVDTFKLSVHIGPYLRKIFKDPKKKKVMHGADRDIIWLQRDFGIYVCNLFDTAQASRVLNMERNSLDFLLQHFCGVTANKEYARENTHYLLYIYDVIRLELQRMAKDGEHTDSPLLEVYKCSYDVCTQLYAKELLTENSLSLEERKDVYLHTEDVASLSLEEKSLQVESNNAGLIPVAAAFAPSSSSVGAEPLIDEYISDEDYEPYTGLDESHMSVPSRSAILHMLPADLLSSLKEEGTTTITRECAEIVLGDERFRLVLETKPISFLRLSDSSGEMEVVWRTGGLPEHYCLSNDIRSKLQPARGYIRDQGMCKLCWGYALCDSISASRVLKGLDREFTSLCPHHLCERVCPARFRKTLEGHRCYLGNIRVAAAYVKQYGVPKEKPSHRNFRCTDRLSIAEDEELFYIEDIFHYHTLEQALVRLKTCPVFATLLIFQGWNEREIYRGPLKKGAKSYSINERFHEVVIVDCVKINGEMIAVCKSSNGIGLGYKGYIFVSLEVMFIKAGATRKVGKTPSCEIEPQHLLFDFFSVDAKSGSSPPRMQEDPREVEKNSVFKVDLNYHDLLPQWISSSVLNAPLTDSDSTTLGNECLYASDCATGEV